MKVAMYRGASCLFSGSQVTLLSNDHLRCA